MHTISRISTLKEIQNKKGKEAVEKVIYGHLGKNQEWCAFSDFTLGTIVEIAGQPLEPLLEQLNALPDNHKGNEI